MSSDSSIHQEVQNRGYRARLIVRVQAMMKAVQYEHHLAQEADQHRAELLCAR